MSHYGRFFIKLSIIINALIAFTSAQATPVIGIGSMYDVLKPEIQSMTKRIYNTGDSTAFVRVEIIKVDPEKKASESETPQMELSGNMLERDRLIVTPLRLIIPPGGFQTVRILWPGERLKERYYRVRFTPVMPETDDGFGLDKAEASAYRQSSLQAGLNVLTGYGTIVMIQPDHPAFNTQINDATADFITVRNNGNASISLENIRQCKLGNTDCSAETREFILPGRTQKLQRKSGYKTFFTLNEGNTTREVSI